MALAISLLPISIFERISIHIPASFIYPYGWLGVGAKIQLCGICNLHQRRHSTDMPFAFQTFKSNLAHRYDPTVYSLFYILTLTTHTFHIYVTNTYIHTYCGSHFEHSVHRIVQSALKHNGFYHRLIHSVITRRVFQILAQLVIHITQVHTFIG